jgi:hypothetical protein
MQTECSVDPFGFTPVDRRRVVAASVGAAIATGDHLRKPFSLRQE